jgi:hypothetical protein
LTNPLKSAPHTQIRGKEHVGITQRPHRDVGRSPRTDAAQGLQPRLSFCSIGPAIEHEDAARDSLRQRSQGVLAAPWNTKGCKISIDKRSGLRENVRQVTVRRSQRLAEAMNESTRDRPSARHGYLLADYRAHRKLEAIDASRQSPSRIGAHDGTKTVVI